MKRVIIAITVEDDVEPADLALDVDYLFTDPDVTDATAWEWEAFWQDYSDGVVSPVVDTTSELGWVNAAIRDREERN